MHQTTTFISKPSHQTLSQLPGGPTIHGYEYDDNKHFTFWAYKYILQLLLSILKIGK